MNLERSNNLDNAPTVVPRQEHSISRKDISHNALKVLYRLNKSGFKAYLVGGCVRDLLLHREPKDFDVATDALPEQIDELFRNCRLIGRRFRLAHIHFGKEIIEVATFRGPASDQERNQLAVDTGMLIRDNTFGTLESDAWRRDFTVNSLYYSIDGFTVIDYVNGLADLSAGIMRPIGDPGIRFREDPVRMLRAVRFAAKLDFQIEPESYQSILKIGDCLMGVPPARLFDEILKLFLTGCAEKTFNLLKHSKLLHYLFPQTAEVIDQQSDPSLLAFLIESLANTDRRVGEDKPVTPAFLCAALLWPVVKVRTQDRVNQGIKNSQALQQVMYEVVELQVQRILIPKRVSVPMREIWSFQPRLERRTGKRPLRLLSHPRFRAAYDFLLLRAAAGESEHIQSLSIWWTQFQTASANERHNMVKNKRRTGKKTRRPRRKSGGNNGSDNKD